MRLPNIKRGPLAPAEIEEITRLATSMKNPTPGKIARALNRHPATIQWQMMLAGVLERRVTYRGPASYMRNGRLIWRFDAAEDASLEQLRVQGLSVCDIAPKLNAEFGRNRTAHSVHVRLVMLGAYDEAIAS